MICFRKAVSLAAFGSLVLAPCLSSAHERDFTLIRDWFLPYQYEREIEYRFTHIRGGDFNSHELEFEYGINPHFAIEPGIEFVKEQGGKLHVDGYDTELRFNFGEYKTKAILPALNLEYEHPADPDEDDRAEIKLIGSYYDDWGNDFTLNLNVGWALEHRKERESEILFGFMHPERANMGHKGLGWKYGFEYDHQMDGGHFSTLGPTVTYRPNQNLHFVAHFGFGLDHADDDTFKLIAEYEFND